MAYVANCGDTRTVLSRNGQAVDITCDQKATDPDEIARITKAGGFVTNGRVMEILAVARAFGDASLKNSSAPKAVTADPLITSFRPEAEDEFIIMATDGLWDVMSSQDAVSFVSQRIRDSVIDVEALREGHGESINADFIKTNLDEIAYSIVDKAYSMGSQDNITAVIILMSRCGSGRDCKFPVCI